MQKFALEFLGAHWLHISDYGVDANVATTITEQKKYGCSPLNMPVGETDVICHIVVDCDQCGK
jgi:hypothetical protein